MVRRRVAFLSFRRTSSQLWEPASKRGGSWPITENEQDCSSPAVVSGGYWNRLGGGSVLGNTVLNLEGRDYEIAGVLLLDHEIEGSYGLTCPSQERSQDEGQRPVSGGDDIRGRIDV